MIAVEAPDRICLTLQTGKQNFLNPDWPKNVRCGSMLTALAKTSYLKTRALDILASLHSLIPGLR